MEDPARTPDRPADQAPRRSRSASKSRARLVALSLLATSGAVTCPSAGAATPMSPLLLAQAAVDPSTLDRKVLVGYQGWFAAPGDGNDPSIGWSHWSSSSTDVGPGLYVVDGWPDMSEYSDVFQTPNVQLLDGSTGKLFSSRSAQTVDRHFAWMSQAGIDGALLQRFVGDILDPRFLALRDAVTRNVQQAAAAQGRVWALEYDISGMSSSNVYDAITHDWQHLVEDLGVLDDPRYLRQDGKPVVAIWGFGFNDRDVSTTEASRVIDFFQSAYGGGYLVGGVPAYWRTLTNDSQTDPAWAQVYRRWDAISPWTVGRYSDPGSLDTFEHDVIAPDIAECGRLGIAYLPVIWPGFSAMNAGWSTSIIPRRGGQFLWEQVYAFQSEGVTMTKVAMFDEVNEATAIFKLSDNHPTTGYWLDNGGYPEDWYMRLAGAAGQTLRGELALTNTIPIDPGVVTGGCCHDDLCDTVTQKTCDELGGTYQGDGTTCGQNSCSSSGCGGHLEAMDRWRSGLPAGRDEPGGSRTGTLPLLLLVGVVGARMRRG